MKQQKNPQLAEIAIILYVITGLIVYGIFCLYGGTSFRLISIALIFIAMIRFFTFLLEHAAPKQHVLTEKSEPKPAPDTNLTVTTKPAKVHAEFTLMDKTGKEISIETILNVPPVTLSHAPTKNDIINLCKHEAYKWFFDAKHVYTLVEEENNE